MLILLLLTANNVINTCFNIIMTESFVRSFVFRVAREWAENFGGWVDHRFRWYSVVTGP